ncbi:hypothetical protein ACHAQJ_005207 [Trichoderma viride]
MPRNLIKSCLRCHERKLKCDAAHVGLPCSRCKKTRGNAADSCVRVLRRPRRRVVGQTLTGEDSPEAPPEPPYCRDDDQVGSSRSSTPRNVECWTPLGVVQAPHSEKDFHTQEARIIAEECEQIATGSSLPSLETMLTPSHAGRDVVQYYSELHYLTIISELVDTKKSSRVTRIIVEDVEPATQLQQQQQPTKTHVRAVMHGLDVVDEEYLNKKSAFRLPPKRYCEAMLQTYFSIAHPHAPILDPVEFLQSYYSGTFSLFLMQAILSNASMYAPMTLLEACGFNGRYEAIETYYSRANVLYQFGCERNQLRSLQGSVVLGLTAMSGSFDRDFRYWLYNAIRDITLLLGGAENMRMIHSEDNEVITLPTPESLGDDIPECYVHLVPPMTQQQRQYFIEFCRLARIATRCFSIVKSHPQDALDYTETEFCLWRASLPELLRITYREPHVLNDTIWHMVLMMASYRFESMLCRILKKESEGRDPDLSRRAAQGVRVAIYELDAVIGRAMAYDVVQMLPMTFVSVVPTVLAIHLELVLSPSESDVVKSRSRIYIHQAIVFLQQCRELPIIKIALGLVDWALTKQNLLSNDISAANNARPRTVSITNANLSHQQDLLEGCDIEAFNNAGENHEMVDISTMDVLERLDEFLELGAMDDTLISDLWQM